MKPSRSALVRSRRPSGTLNLQQEERDDERELEALEANEQFLMALTETRGSMLVPRAGGDTSVSGGPSFVLVKGGEGGRGAARPVDVDTSLGILSTTAMQRLQAARVATLRATGRLHQEASSSALATSVGPSREISTRPSETGPSAGPAAQEVKFISFEELGITEEDLERA